MFGLILLLSFNSPVLAASASLYLSPATAKFDVGDSMAMAIYVNSDEQAINAVSGVLAFPADKLEVSSLSKSGSVINLWVLEPTFSNSTGRVSFEGLILNPGFVGTGGKVITVNFKVKAAGTAYLSLSSASVLANDGLGTNILTSLGSASYELSSESGQLPTEPAAQPEARSETAGESQPVVVDRVPYAPTVISETHPDQNAWYQENIPKFSWSLPAGTTGVRLLVGKLPNAAPSVSYIPAISSRELDELDDGVWYFHIRLRNSAGWGDITHYKFQIDTQAPEAFMLDQIAREDLTDPKVQLVFEAEDATSGIDHYEIQLNGGEVEIWRDDGSHTYQTPALEPGDYVAAVKAADKAGNYLSQKTEFTIEPLAAPQITDYPKELFAGKTLTIKGLAYPSVQVAVFLERVGSEPVSQSVTSDATGKGLAAGSYKVWARVIDDRGASSQDSEILNIIVKPEKILGLSQWPWNYIATILLLAALIVALAINILMIKKKKRRYYGDILENKQKIEQEIRQVFQLIKQSIEESEKDIQFKAGLLEKLKARKPLNALEKKEVDRICRTFKARRAKKDIVHVKVQVKAKPKSKKPIKS